MTSGRHVPPKDLRSYLADLAREHPADLVTISRPVSSDHERSAVVKALEPLGCPAVLFAHVDGRAQRVVMGLFGTRSRIADALGVGVDECVQHLVDTDLTRQTPEVMTGAAPVHTHLATGGQVNLADLPVGIHSRDDAGRYITSGVLLVRDPVTGKLNAGIYRLAVTGCNTMTVNGGPGHDLGRIIRSAPTGAQIPFALVIGHHPAISVASQLKHSTDIDAYRAMSSLLNEPLRLAPAVTVDLLVPGDAEYILEGTIDTGKWVEEGPFGEFTYYAGNAVAPVATVSAVTCRDDPIFLDLHPTHNEHRALWLFPGREARLLTAVRARVPGTRAVAIPSEGAGLLARISITKRHPADARTAIIAALNSDDTLKQVIVVDDDIDVHDSGQVEWALGVRFQAGNDLVVIPQLRGIRMDPSATRPAGAAPGQVVSDKIGVDATAPVADFPGRADLVGEEFTALDLFGYLDGGELRARLDRHRALDRSRRI